MKRLIVVVTLLVMLAASSLLGIADAKTSVADISILDKRVVNSIGEVGSPNSARAVITITGHTLANE